MFNNVLLYIVYTNPIAILQFHYFTYAQPVPKWLQPQELKLPRLNFS